MGGFKLGKHTCGYQCLTFGIGSKMSGYQTFLQKGQNFPGPNIRHIMLLVFMFVKGT